MDTIVEGNIDSSSSEVKPDVKPDIPTHDDGGVPYYNRFREAQEKYKDIDLDRWKEVKDLDLDDLRKAKDFRDSLLSDESKYRRVLKALEEKEESEDSSDPVAKKLQAIEARLQGFEQMTQHEKQQEWMKSYDNALNSTIDSTLKTELKDLGELSPFEKQSVLNLVDKIFQQDANQKSPKLSLEDVPKVTKEALKAISENRTWLTSKRVKKDSSPEPIHGRSSDALPSSKKVMDSKERVASLADELKGLQGLNL